MSLFNLCAIFSFEELKKIKVFLFAYLINYEIYFINNLVQTANFEVNVLYTNRSKKK